MSKIIDVENSLQKKYESKISEKPHINSNKENMPCDVTDANSDILNSYNYNIFCNNQKNSNLPIQTYSPKNNQIKYNEEKKEQINDINNINDFDIINKVIRNLTIDGKNSNSTKSKFDFAQSNNQSNDNDIESNILLGNDFNNSEFDSIFSKKDSEKKTSKFNFTFNEMNNNISNQNNINNFLGISDSNNNNKYYINNNNFNMNNNNYLDMNCKIEDTNNGFPTKNNKNIYNNNYSNNNLNENRNKNSNINNKFFINNKNNINNMINNINYINSFPNVNNNNVYLNIYNENNDLPYNYNYTNNINCFSTNNKIIENNLQLNYNNFTFNINNINTNNNNSSYSKIINNNKNHNNNNNSIEKGNNQNYNNNNNQKKDVIDIKQIYDSIEKAIKLIDANNRKNKISKEQKELNEEIISNIKNIILSTAKDVSGNYSIQKIINNNSNNSPKFKFIIDSIKTKIFELTLHLYGCRVIQEIISALEEKDLYIITSELKEKYNRCIEDKNGNHVIQRLIEKLSPENNSDIFLVASKNIISLSKHQYGCRVIQRLFRYCNQEQINIMLKEIFLYINELILDQYGNYVIQYILENNKKNNNLNEVYQSLKNHIYEYSFHKFASNVIEKALIFGNQIQRNEIINEIMLLDEKQNNSIITLVQNKFGNYVIQKMIEYSDIQTQKKIVKKILKNENLLKNEGFSKYVLNFIQKINSNKQLNIK